MTNTPDKSEMVEAAFAMLCRKYVQRADERQRGMGLQYTEAETHDLAKTIATFAALQAVPASGGVGMRELVDAVGETLDKDFGFWSSPTQSERRSRLYNAWKAVSTALKASGEE